MVTRGEKEGVEAYIGSSMNRYTLLPVKEISNGDLQNNTGNDIQYPAITYNGNQSETILDMENGIPFAVRLKLTPYS